MAEGLPAIPPVKGLLFMKYLSERVPGKNLKPICGQPLFYWIIKALKESRHVEEIILNTDSEVIAEQVTSRFDVTIHMRPDHLLRIDSNEANQILEYDLTLTDGEYFLQTHSTNPLLTAGTIDRSVETFFQRALPEGYDSLFSVTSHRKRFFRPDGSPVNHEPGRLIKTQALELLLEENSCLYLFSRSSFHRAGANRIGARPYLFAISAREAIDIDTEEDFRIAEKILHS